MEVRRFHVADYLVCLFVLLVSLAIGIFYAFTGGKQKTVREYILGDRKMAILPVATSMAVTYLSTLSILGYPVEVYQYGIAFWLYLIGKCIGITLVAVLFVPLFYPLNLTSITEYLQLRYKSNIVVKYGSALQIISMLLFNGATLYGPTTIMQTVAGIPAWVSLLVSGVVGAVCTTLGGYKGVIWTDTFQALIMLAGLMGLLIQCSINVGGMGNAWKVYGDTGRLHVEVTPSLFNRMDLWSTLLAFSGNIYMFGTTQAGFQRYCSVSSKTSAYIAAVMAAPVTVVVVSLSVLLGVVGFAYYQIQGCHPLAAGYITNSNGIVPYMVMDILHLPGAPGLFVAACLCGSLSNVSSAINSAAALLWRDFLQHRFQHLPEDNNAKCIKIIAFICGIVSIGAGFLAAFVGGTLMKIANSVLTVSQVPLGLLFLLGGLFPRVNWRNVLVTSLLVYTFLMTLPITSTIYRVKSKPLPLDTTNCTQELEYSPVMEEGLWSTQTPAGQISNTTYQANPSMEVFSTSGSKDTHEKILSGIEKYSTISFLWYPTLGNALGIIISLTLSLIPGFRSEEEVESRLLFPFVRRFVRKERKKETEQEEMKELSDKQHT